MLKDTLKKIPGFRTGSKWKMVLSLFFYLCFFIILINPQGATPRDKLVNITQSLIMIGIPFVLFTNLGYIRNKLPIFNKRTIKANILGAFIYIFIIVILFSIADTWKSPEQKQLDLLAARQTEEKSQAKKVALALDDKIIALGNIDDLTYNKVNVTAKVDYESQIISIVSQND